MPLSSYRIIDSTLREGEQCRQATFDSRDRTDIARALSEFGVEYVELTSPRASPRSREDYHRICDMGLAARVLTHIRCDVGDADAALEARPAGLNVVIGVSPQLRGVSHGMTLPALVDHAARVLAHVRDRAPAIELRFSLEDAFRCPTDDLLAVYAGLEGRGLADRFGVADTTGGATPRGVYEVVSRLRAQLDVDIEFHGHDDADCAVANAYCALEAGATHVDTSVLGIGERNGITSLEGLIARTCVADAEATARRYRLDRLPALSALVAERVGTPIPPDHPVVGANAFAHKAGIHTNGMLKDPNSYEILDPATFGRQRTLLVAHRLTGSNAVRHRARALGLELSPAAIEEVTGWVKRESDRRDVSPAELDEALRSREAPAPHADATRR